ncbi:MAG TPA: ATP-binding protein, partial [Kofleriaceae bacterium]|nr:ATP-binding protein [Kofleriaceae bacterium]
RVERPILPAARATALLDTYRPLIAAFVGRAIALAWDQGRIAFPNESHLPFRDEVAGILGRMAGRAPDEVAAAERQILEASEAARAAEAAIAPGVAPLTALAEEHGLSPVARLLLLLIAGPSLWGELARLYGILGNDEQRPLVDEQLLIQILDGQIGRHEVARELDRDAPLLRNGIVRPGAGRMRPFIELSCEPIVLRILKASGPDREPGDVRIVRAACAFEDLLIPAATQDAVARAIAEAPAPGRIVIRGRVGAGRHTLLAALAASANRTLGVIDATAIVRDLRARIGQLRSALYRAHLLGLLPCVDGLETLASEDHAARDLIAGVLEEHPGPLAVRLPWDGQPLLRPGHVAIDLPALSLSQRGACWDRLLRNHGLYVRVPDELAERFGVGPGVIDRVCRRVAQTQVQVQAQAPAAADAAANDGASGPRDRSRELEAAVRQHLESRLGATSTRVARLATWSRVVLPPDIQESVLELIARIKHRRTVYDAWGFDRVLTTARGVTALFQGGPGTGKTLVASAIANELGMDLYRVDLSRIMSKWIGETEQNLAKLFDAAEDGHAIILFDEADSLFARRTEVRTSID